MTPTLVFGLTFVLAAGAETVHAPRLFGARVPASLMAPMLTMAIVGKDDRIDFFQETDPQLKRLAGSTAVLIEKKSGGLEKTASGFRLSSSTKTHGEFDRLCTGETYADQPAPGSCSAFLVAEDLLATAGHCVEKGCEGFHFVFDFQVRARGQVRTTFTEDQVHECRSVVARDSEEDWALVRLKKTVSRAPFRLRASGEPKEGAPLTLIGYPRGLPVKIASNGKVVAPVHADPAIFLEAEMDSFGGNSGSPVINSDTLEVEGIDVVGFGEFEEETVDLSTGKKCRRLRRMTPAEHTPSWVTRTSRFRQAVRQAQAGPTP